ncbi:uncharacterized protein LOC143371175 [Andrena cerasifolii]|uniref:uncharacterized protein LOC143371175 n=1 Tax=Andrena cerasifolii TaxID=2819439 RepID=UPI0040378BD0
MSLVGEAETRLEQNKPNLKEENTDSVEIEGENTIDRINKPEPFLLQGNVAENWRKIKRDFELFMIATTRRMKSKAIQAATLLNLIGSDALEVFETFNLEEGDTEDPEKIIKAFQDYVEPQRNETYERFLFNSRKRQEGETFEHYVTELKKMAKRCNYSTLVESMIRDNIIYHMTDSKLQQTVLKSQDLQLETLIKQIKTHELTKKQTNEIQGGTTQKVNTVHKDPIRCVKGKFNKNRRGTR